MRQEGHNFKARLGYIHSKTLSQKIPLRCIISLIGKTPFSCVVDVDTETFGREGRLDRIRGKLVT